ncbi:MAG: hypothetical protein PHZ07_04205 [Patescibacteria group bacterium]|nr:hypothetical protein [Patescibacteria group bacterium]MDD4304769.1 hypothetical protein [Patescibacteria group bacterium]MDD4695492.1 hypothetical protein [Patescibacteria group bacterium]
MNKKKVPTKNSTLDVLEIADIRDNTIILKDGTVRAVLMVSSVNFALKNSDEQEAIISGYYSFLNSLTYPIQIVIQSRNLDIDEYLLKLDKLAKQQTNELLRMQTLDYLQFVNELLELQSIMTKKFFMIIPYSTLSNTKKSFFSKTSNLFSAAKNIRMKKKFFEEYKEQLFRRVAQIQEGLSSMNLQAVILDTASLVELYYNSYNPSIYKNEKLNDISKVKIDN